MRSALLALCAVLAASCLDVSSPVAPNSPLDTPFEVKAGATAVVPGGLTIRFDSVSSDSRCPIDALCVQAGEAVVVMSLSTPSRSRVQREWRTNPTGFEVVYSDYAIQLAELRPYPSAGQPIAPGDYVATLKVIKR
jgi:hypothetical protein